MKFFLTKGLKIESIPRLTWLSNNAHRIVSVKAINHNHSNKGKMIVRMKDDSYFHASFWSFRSLVAWLFHKEYAGVPILMMGLHGPEAFGSDDGSPTTAGTLVTAGSAEHWEILTQILST